MSSIYEDFGVISEDFKLFKEDATYKEYSDVKVTFDSKSLELDSYTNLRDIMLELNEISRKIFTYGIVFESQSRVVQNLEDEFDMWMAKKYFEIGTILPPLQKSEKRTEKEKENFIKTHFEKEYKEFSENISKEKYKLGIIKRVVSGLENYSFKLHALKDYNMASNNSNG